MDGSRESLGAMEQLSPVIRVGLSQSSIVWPSIPVSGRPLFSQSHHAGAGTRNQRYRPTQPATITCLWVAAAAGLTLRLVKDTVVDSTTTRWPRLSSANLKIPKCEPR